MRSDAPHIRSWEVIVRWGVEDDLRDEAALPLAFEQTLDLLECARFVECGPAHRDEAGIPVPLERIQPIRRHRVPAAVVRPQDLARLFFGHAASSATPVSGCIQARCGSVPAASMIMVPAFDDRSGGTSARMRWPSVSPVRSRCEPRGSTTWIWKGRPWSAMIQILRPDAKHDRAVRAARRTQGQAVKLDDPGYYGQAKEVHRRAADEAADEAVRGRR